MKLASDGKTIVIRIPYRFRRTGGRKEIIAPEGVESAFLPPTRPDEALIRALVRAFRWQEMMESGQAASVKDLATREKIDPSYVARTLRLTLLAPDIVEAILEGRQPESLSVEKMRLQFPVAWEEQRRHWGMAKSAGEGQLSFAV
ncbi:MAG: hypothetical protein HQL52_13620 [Magnetococcales bacterium]|nr:hypothetical protein [Magnetococcales bacterium]